jgi:hypothetical protein
MPRVPQNIDYYKGNEHTKMEEYFYRLQLMANHGHTPEDFERIRMIRDGLLNPDGSEIVEEKDEKHSHELEVVEKDEQE